MAGDSGHKDRSSLSESVRQLTMRIVRVNQGEIVVTQDTMEEFFPHFSWRLSDGTTQDTERVRTRLEATYYMNRGPNTESG